MKPNRYPRINEVIAPATLRLVLDHPVDARLRSSTGVVRLNSFDAASWQRYPESVCRQAADAVVQTISIAISQRSHVLFEARVPTVAARADALRVGNRAMNVLIREGLHQDLSLLGNFTVGRLLEFPALGASSLVDLLAALESMPVERDLSAQPAGWGCWIDGEEMSVPPWLLRIALPPLPEDLMLEQLDLDNRTRNALSNSPFGRRPGRLAGFHVEELLTLEGLGVNCIRVLLRAVDRVVKHGILSAPPPLVGNELPSPSCLEDELVGCFVWPAARPAVVERRARLFSRYHQLQGGPDLTLEQLGQEEGITRERVRQLVHIDQPTRTDAPLLDRAWGIVKRMLPASESTILDALLLAGLLRHKVPLARLMALAKALGRETFPLVETHDGPCVVLPDTKKALGVLLRLARSYARRNGAVCLKQLSEEKYAFTG